MAQNIDAQRLRMLDGPGPQYIKHGQNEPDWVRGSDGGQHVKIVDSNGNPIYTIPTKDNTVKHAVDGVGTKISALEDKLQAVDDKLSSVIEDDAFNTRVTGSNVEDAIPVHQVKDDSKKIEILKEDDSDTPLSEGETYNLIYDDESVSEYSKILVLIRLRDHRRDLEVEVVSGTGSRIIVLDSVQFDREFRFNHVFDVSDEKLTVRVTNNDTDTDIRYQKVVGIK